MRNKNGYILIVTLLVSAALIFYAISFTSFYMSEQRIAQNGEWVLIAQEAANAGIESAALDIKNGITSWASYNNVKLPNSGATYTVTFDKVQTAIPYSTDNSAGSAAITGWNGRIVPAGTYHIVSVGKYGGSSRQATHIEEAMIGKGSSMFINALFVADSINLHGSQRLIVDSFDSSKGTYDDTKLQSGGNIGTDSDKNGIVQLKGNATVYGSVTVGPNGTEDDSINCGQNCSYQSFTTSPPSNYKVIPAPLPIPPGTATNVGGMTLLSPGSYPSDIFKGDGIYKLVPGTYYFQGGIDLSGKSQIVLDETSTGEIKLYTDGNIDLTGQSSLNAPDPAYPDTTGIPKRLQIYGGENTTNVKLAGHGNTYFLLYAPNADIVLHGSPDVGIYGSVVGKSFTMSGNGSLHFDRSLLTTTDGKEFQIMSRW